MNQVWIAAAEAISEALVGASITPEKIRAVAVTGQGDGSWLVDGDGKPVGPAILWTDGRAGDLVDRWNSDGTISEAFGLTGGGPYAGGPLGGCCP